MDKELKKITDAAIKAKTRALYSTGKTDREYRNLVREQSKMFDQIRSESGGRKSMRDAAKEAGYRD